MFWNRKEKPVVVVETPVIEVPNVESLTEVTVLETKDQNSPEMKRKYSVPLPNGRSMEIEFRTTYWNKKRDTSAMLFQSDRSKYLFFRVEAIADEILDSRLVLFVQKYVAEMIRLDDEYLASDPKEYIDSKGVKWTRGS